VVVDPLDLPVSLHAPIVNRQFQHQQPARLNVLSQTLERAWHVSDVLEDVVADYSLIAPLGRQFVEVAVYSNSERAGDGRRGGVDLKSLDEPHIVLNVQSHAAAATAEVEHGIEAVNVRPEILIVEALAWMVRVSVLDGGVCLAALPTIMLTYRHGAS
jgi:hypothetical protein